jgi:hypothetical protein
MRRSIDRRRGSNGEGEEVEFQIFNFRFYDRTTGISPFAGFSLDSLAKTKHGSLSVEIVGYLAIFLLTGVSGVLRKSAFNRELLTFRYRQMSYLPFTVYLLKGIKNET